LQQTGALEVLPPREGEAPLLCRELRISADEEEILRETGGVDLVVIAVKSKDTSAAAQAAQRLVSPTGYVLSIQNGDNTEALAEVLGRERLLMASTTQVSGFTN
jgi:ketopantoate reductase